MQIPPPSSAAASAGSTISQSGNKDSTPATKGTMPTAAVGNNSEQVERSESASADRDAQGQGDGLGERSHRQEEEQADVEHRDQPAPLLPGEEPGELDILG